MLHGILQVLHNSLLSDDLSNLGLGVDVERVRIQHLDLPLPFGSLAAISLVGLGIDLGESGGVLQRTRQLGLLPRDFSTQTRVSQQLQPYHLCVLVWTPRPLLLRLGWAVGVRGRHAGRAAHVPDMQGQQLSVANLQVRHGLGVVGDELTIVIEVLRGGFDARLGLDGAAERLDRHIRVDFERDKVLVVAPLLGVGDAERDPPG